MPVIAMPVPPAAAIRSAITCGWFSSHGRCAIQSAVVDAPIAIAIDATKSVRSYSIAGRICSAFMPV